MTRITLEQAKHLQIGELSSLTAAQLYQLWAENSNKLESSRKFKQWLESAIALKYQEQIQAKRIRLDKMTGIIHIEDDGIKISTDIHKKIEWQQDILSKVVDDLRQSDIDTSEYVNVAYKVPESKYISWPKSVQQIFDAARQMKTGIPSYYLSKIESNHKLVGDGS